MFELEEEEDDDEEGEEDSERAARDDEDPPDCVVNRHLQRNVLLVHHTLSTRKSSCVNARGISPAM